MQIAIVKHAESENLDISKIQNVGRAALLEIRKSRYLRNRSTDRVKICIFHKFKMAGDRHIENEKFAISPQQFNRSRQNLQIVIVNRAESENLHFSKIQNGGRPPYWK